MATTEPLLAPRPGPAPAGAEAGYRVCTRCIMDTSEPEIVFDEEGVCNHCKHYLQRVATDKFTGAEGKARLERLVETIRAEGKSKEYDCIIGVSGGVDSTSVAHTVKRKLGLRPLALHLDNGWDSELAVDNIQKTLQALEIDLHTHVIDWEEFRDFQLSFLKASVINCEIPTDHAIVALLLNTALRTGVRFILTGSNITSEGIMPVTWAYYHEDHKHLRAVHKRFGTAKLKTTPQIGFWKFLYAVLVRKVKFIPLLNYLDYNKAEAKKLIMEDLGWRDYGGKHYESIYTRFYQGYYLPRKFGIDKRRAHLSCLVLAGEMTRDEALREMARDAYADLNAKEDREYVIKKFGLTEEQWEAIMAAPPKAHTDYPSRSWLYHDLRGLKQWFKRIATRV